jgi:hypothetical protein
MRCFDGSTLPQRQLVRLSLLRSFVPECCAPPSAAKTHYGTSLANVDWLHGSAESLLTVTNLLIGERQGSSGDGDGVEGES